LVKIFNAPEIIKLAIMKASPDKRKMGASAGVCGVAGQFDLATAQKAIASDWMAAYKRCEGPTPNHARARRGRE
jgi:hypothetical protein